MGNCLIGYFQDQTHGYDQGKEGGGIELNIAKGTTDPRVEFISQALTQILNKFHFQNLN